MGLHMADRTEQPKEQAVGKVCRNPAEWNWGHFGNPRGGYWAGSTGLGTVGARLRRQSRRSRNTTERQSVSLSVTSGGERIRRFAVLSAGRRAQSTVNMAPSIPRQRGEVGVAVSLGELQIWGSWGIDSQGVLATVSG